MKKLIISVSFLVALLVSPVVLQAQEPVDLVSMQEAGLSTETLGRYLAQNLGGNRLAPPVDANLLTRLGQYGGDSLARAYLDLDKATAQLPTREFSPDVVDQLMASRLAPAELTKLLRGETARYAAGQAAAPLAPSAGDEPAEAPAAAPVPTQISVAPQAPVAPQMTAALTQAEAPIIVIPQASAPMYSPAPQAPAAPRATFQQLRPGQAADPGSALPLPYSTYDIRNNRRDGDFRAPQASGPWMGVGERELADGHVVEVHANGDRALVGQEVYARPSGHQVYRYFSRTSNN